MDPWRLGGWTYQHRNGLVRLRIQFIVWGFGQQYHWLRSLCSIYYLREIVCANLFVRFLVTWLCNLASAFLRFELKIMWLLHMTCFNLGCKADWVLQNHTHYCFWGYLPAHIVIGLQKHMSRQPINLRCVCSQFGDQHHRSMAVMSHRRRTPEMSSASFRKNMPELEAVITSLVLNQCCRFSRHIA